jgi:hypothetical protein
MMVTALRSSALSHPAFMSPFKEEPIPSLSDSSFFSSVVSSEPRGVDWEGKGLLFNTLDVLLIPEEAAANT